MTLVILIDNGTLTNQTARLVATVVTKSNRWKILTFSKVSGIYELPTALATIP